MNQISPRIFEAVSLHTLLVLYPGTYSGIIQPWVHYFPLDKNLGNIEQLIKLLENKNLVKEITDRAYIDLIVSQKYSAQAYFTMIENALLSISLPSSSPARKVPKYPQKAIQEGKFALPSSTRIIDRNFRGKKFARVLWRLIPQNLRYWIIKVLSRK